MKRGLVVFVTAATAFFYQATPARAHVRDYLLSEPYYTTQKGEFEVELRNDLNMKEAGNDGTYSSKHQVELEYGLTDHFQVAYYEVFKWDRTNDARRDALKIETKYRFLETNELPVDITLYGEYENPNGHQDTDSDGIEGKVILSKNVGPWNFIGNFIAERKINQKADWEMAYTVGVSHPLSPQIRLGLELKETLGDSGDFGIRRKDHQVQLVPGIYASLTPHLRVLFGPAIGLTRAADDVQLRSIVEMEF